VIEQDSQGNIRPSKAKSSEKIDVAVAGIMATARARVQAIAGTSVYESRGLRVL
jgi:phage terminase large subunit-like protein